jgi:hypothetical protein
MTMSIRKGSLLLAACFSLSLSQIAIAGSCCGGGSGANVLLPKTGTLMVDVSSSVEIYDGQWNRQGQWQADPAGSDLRQYRLTTAAAYPLAANWQGSVIPITISNRILQDWAIAS